jgi:mono/diheme cytochrome c family protein
MEPVGYRKAGTHSDDAGAHLEGPDAECALESRLTHVLCWRTGAHFAGTCAGTLIRVARIMTWLVFSATPLLAGNAPHGEALYHRYCSGCHGADGRGGGKGFMPHVGALTRKGYIDLIDDISLALVIAEGGEAIGKSGFMPSWKATLSKDDIADVIAYIRTLPLSDGPQ